MSSKKFLFVAGLAPILIMGGCTVTSTISSSPTPVEAYEMEMKTVDRPHVHKNGPDHTHRVRNEVGTIAYSLPQTWLVIEGGPCVTQSKPAAKPTSPTKTTASQSVAEGGTQINISSSTAATSTATATTATEAKKASPSGASCDKTSDTAPFGINVTTMTVADPSRSYQVVANLADFSTDTHTLKVNAKGLLDSSATTTSSQARQVALELAELAGALSGLGPVTLSDEELESVKRDGQVFAIVGAEEEVLYNPSRHKLGAFKIICPVDEAVFRGQQICFGSVPVTGKTIASETTLTNETKAIGLPSGKEYLESRVDCDDATRTRLDDSDESTCKVSTFLTTTTVKNGTSEETYKFNRIETKVVAKKPTVPIFAYFSILLPNNEARSASRKPDRQEGLLFRAPTTVSGRVDFYTADNRLFSAWREFKSVKSLLNELSEEMPSADTIGSMLFYERSAENIKSRLELIASRHEGDDSDLFEYYGEAIQVLSDIAANASDSKNIALSMLDGAELNFETQEDFEAVPVAAGSAVAAAQNLMIFYGWASAVEDSLERDLNNKTIDPIKTKIPTRAIPLTVIDPTRIYSVTKIRRGFVDTKTTLDFQDGQLVEYSAEFPGPAGAIAAIPGDLIQGFFGAVKDVFTLRIETINSQVGLLQAEDSLANAEQGIFPDAIESSDDTSADE